MIQHRPWPAIFRAMRVLSDAGVTSEDAYLVLKVEVLAVGRDEDGDAVIPKARRPGGASGALSTLKAGGGSTRD